MTIPIHTSFHGNGIDEDCSGKDLDLDELRAKARWQETSDSAYFNRPKLPEDISVVLITIDSLRWDAPGFMGNPRDVTPYLDQLATRFAGNRHIPFLQTGRRPRNFFQATERMRSFNLTTTSEGGVAARALRA